MQYVYGNNRRLCSSSSHISARSIVFINWDAEEYGLVGSTEFVEEFTEILSKRTIAYLNVDEGVTGNLTMYVGLIYMFDIKYIAKSPIQRPEFGTNAISGFDDRREIYSQSNAKRIVSKSNHGLRYVVNIF
jgi:hypothetical protein